MDVQYLLSVVYHNLGMESQREEAATNHFQTEEKMKRLGAVVVDEEVQEVWKLVVDVGAALSAR
jgi:anaphase-promoting complex subunit 5